MSDARQEVDAVVAQGRLAENLWDVATTAKFLGRPEGTLQQWRQRKAGPRWYKVGGSVMYDPHDVRAYLLGNATETAA